MSKIALTKVKVIDRGTYWQVKEPRISRHNDAVWNCTEEVPKDGRWQFNGNFECPTFSPSINAKSGPFPDGSIRINHFIITDGKIQYCGDCTHEFAGQTHDLVPFNEYEVEGACQA